MAQGADRTTGWGRPEAELFAEMRRIKEAARLSYNRLADKTHYSRSSWERFLNGKQVPTRVAVEEFATAAAPAPDAAAPVLVPAAADHGRRTPRARRRAVLAMAACALAGAVLGSVLTVIGLSGVVGASGGASAAFGSRGRSASTAPADGGTGTDAPAPRPTAPIRTGCKSDTCLLREPQAMDCHWDATTVRRTWLRA
ncbi:helix-turn-helix domain-containing protein [Streptomyces sp. NPDC086023]|uniref:helix-turn-helix domain-containing protein n=1 Tax=Streptomyces sp. NPDC086023 TaxID=3365746 RepID=UPI0037D0139A